MKRKLTMPAVAMASLATVACHPSGAPTALAETVTQQFPDATRKQVETLVDLNQILQEQREAIRDLLVELEANTQPCLAAFYPDYPAYFAAPIESPNAEAKIHHFQALVAYGELHKEVLRISTAYSDRKAFSVARERDIYRYYVNLGLFKGAIIDPARKYFASLIRAKPGKEQVRITAETDSVSEWYKLQHRLCVATMEGDEVNSK